MKTIELTQGKVALVDDADLDPDLCLAMFRADVSPRFAATRALMHAGILTSAGALYVG